jgi:hypothetical protein
MRRAFVLPLLGAGAALVALAVLRFTIPFN